MRPPFSPIGGALEEMYQRLFQSLVSEATIETPIPQALTYLVDQMNRYGQQIGGMTLMMRTPYPELEMVVIRWRRDDVSEAKIDAVETVRRRETLDEPVGKIEVYELSHGHSNEETYKRSPFHYAEQHPGVHLWQIQEHLDPPKFPIFKDFDARGETAYLVTNLQLPFPMAAQASLSTYAPGGFSDDFHACVLELVPALRLAIAHKLQRLTSKTLLQSYLGSLAVDEIFQGRVLLNDLRSMRAIIGLLDVRSFTALSMENPPEVVAKLLGELFEIVHQQLKGEGGEILKFIGDAVLFIFPIGEGDDRRVTRQALVMTERLIESYAAIQGPLGFGIGLHIGEVRYGNIGAPQRLDFSVLGRCVRRAEQLEQVASQLGQTVVLSEEFVAGYGGGCKRLAEVTLSPDEGPVSIFSPEPLQARE